MKKFKLVVIGNYLNHHSIPLYNKIAELLGDNFMHISTIRVPKRRVDLGYEDLSEHYTYNINAYESEEKYQFAMNASFNADIVIIGAASDIYIEKRLATNKITIRWSERLFKEGIWKILHPKIAKRLYDKHIKYKDKNLFMFCISSYLPWDLKRINCYKGKMFKWGYFPETRIYSNKEVYLNKQNEIPEILWVGRLIGWKHPEHAIKIAKMLKKNGYRFNLNIIGIGSKQNKILSMIKKYDLHDCVNYLGVKTPNEVRRYMEKANIFLFTSDFNEGWGAVLNEAMNSGCVVIASHAIGSVPYLINDGVNGFIYKNKNIEEAYTKVCQILDNKEMMINMGDNAVKTILSSWNAENAARVLVKICSNLLDGNVNFEVCGPGSKAETLTNNYWK